MTVQKLNQNVNVAVSMEGISQDRAKKCQALNVMLAAKVMKRLLLFLAQVGLQRHADSIEHWFEGKKFLRQKIKAILVQFGY